jgi:23S rRNA (pseudouridine1915-N3)-methyltransferase
MKIKLLQLGKTNDEDLITGIARYEKRLSLYASFLCETIPALKDTSSLSPAQIKQKEGELLLHKFKNDDYVILLDEKGKSFTSVAFARHIEQLQNHSTRQLVFVVGGAFGFSEAVYNRAQMKLSLSEMTFSHQLIRLIFMEQLYRAFTILNNHPYHNT